MKTQFIAAMALGLSTATANAAGLDRSGQSITDVFAVGTVAKFSFGATDARVSGAGVPDVGQGFGTNSASYKTDFGDRVSFALIWDQPFGANTSYAQDPAASAFGGTRASVDTNAITGVANYRFDGGFSVHGGLRVQQAEGGVTLNGLAFGPVAGYNLDLARDTSVGWLAGVAYEKTDIALRVSLTYNSEIDHSFASIDSIAGAVTTNVTTPESWNLAFQTGIAKDTLLFGSIRYANYDDFIVPAAGLGGLNLASLDSATTFSLGIGRKFTDTWSGAVILGYEDGGSDNLVSPLAPTNGFTSLGLAATYTKDNMKITTGVRYTDLGDAIASTTGASVPFNGNSAVSAGVSVAFSF
jgi:long-subunit fatty acid transport protein